MCNTIIDNMKAEDAMDDIRDIAKRIVKLFKEDKDFEEKYDRNPAGAIEEVLGIDLPDEKLNKLIDIIEDKLDLDDFDMDDLLDKDKIPGLSGFGKLPD